MAKKGKFVRMRPVGRMQLIRGPVQSWNFDPGHRVISIMAENGLPTSWFLLAYSGLHAHIHREILAGP